MKYLNQFQEFNFDRFAEGKVFRVIGQSEYKDFDTNEHLGTKVEAVIFKDDTEYKHKEGETGSNLFEKINFKVSKDLTVNEGDVILPVDPHCTIYGEYRNQLSVKCADIKVLKTRNTAAQGVA